MSTQSLDEVLADVDASEQEIANEIPETPEAEASGETEAEGQGEGDQGHDAHGALHAERNRVRRKYTDTVAEFDRKFTEATANFDRKLAEREQAINQQWEQRFGQFAQQFQQPRQEPTQAPPEEAGDPLDALFKDANGFVTQHTSKALDPVNQRIASVVEMFSRRMAIKDHGEEKVQAAFNALDQAAKSGNRDALEMVAKVKQSDDPYGLLVDWHSKTSVLSEFGSDPEAAIQKRLAAALEDPAFLAKAAEKLGVKPAPARQQQSSGQGLPSLNRVTAAADDDDEEEDATEVFNSALRSGVRR